MPKSRGCWYVLYFDFLFLLSFLLSNVHFERNALDFITGPAHGSQYNIQWNHLLGMNMMVTRQHGKSWKEHEIWFISEFSNRLQIQTHKDIRRKFHHYSLLLYTRICWKAHEKYKIPPKLSHRLAHLCLSGRFHQFLMKIWFSEHCQDHLKLKMVVNLEVNYSVIILTQCYMFMSHIACSQSTHWTWPIYLYGYEHVWPYIPPISEFSNKLQSRDTLGYSKNFQHYSLLFCTRICWKALNLSPQKQRIWHNL